jgi:hypothetical protein
VGLNIGYGIGEGVADSEGSILDTVTDVADAIAEEFNAGDYGSFQIASDTEIDSTLTSFADKVSDSFTLLLEKLQAIAENVTFAAPDIATYGAIPYRSTAATAAAADTSGAIEASSEELGSVFIQALTNATVAIVEAIQNYSGTTVNLDSDSLTSAVVKEINRRTRMSGQSPLLT